MNLKLSSSGLKNASIAVTGSKSESNRLLILQALYPNLTITNVSNSDDTKVLQKALPSKYTITQQKPKNVFASSETMEVPKTKFQQLQPLFLIFGYLVASAILLIIRSGIPPKRCSILWGFSISFLASLSYWI